MYCDVDKAVIKKTMKIVEKKTRLQSDVETILIFSYLYSTQSRRFTFKVMIYLRKTKNLCQFYQK